MTQFHDTMTTLITLDTLTMGTPATVHRVDAKRIPDLGINAEELERRLLESGLVEGVQVTVVHEAPIARDPIVVVLDGEGLLALRRREARAVHVDLDGQNPET